jgi:hypothetical protein
MFRDDRQTARVCRVLLGGVRLARLWTDAGPTDEALELLKAGGGPLSSGEALVIRVAFDFWNGQGEASLARLLEVLDPGRLEALGSLLVALARGAGAVDAWLELAEAAR